ncbi:DUF4342 domain-containing protein [Clostridium chromiireducens]|uniref:DUF4342 domain-containing protein n=1 Tax=Clostridium chromiireducens TaxID=225345 RepID=A0A1V4IXA4_9CLOT|nr:DUF4342 domain-containing protein [Clostridium chromiireducens]MVX66425.1 DUF4342 domain-containing protein [Clostridium chromiireducens]OPJ64692.1 hypothetical protein CLCHR_10450 [Clostridium chromiireducens]RII36004.1 DUF4342 domain-containing protein [Clostridium chromiireducens]
MERDEMIKVLMEKTKVSYEEAEEALQNCDFDLLDSIIYLERKGKVENDAANTIIEVAVEGEEENKKENEENHKKKCGGIGEIIGRVFKFMKKIIIKGNENYFEMKKEDKKPVRISLTISALLLIIGFWPVTILLVVGLFLGYKYSITGNDINKDKVNDILNKASESADNIKSDFKEGYKAN